MMKPEFSGIGLWNQKLGVLYIYIVVVEKCSFFHHTSRFLHLLYYITAWFTVQEQLLISILGIQLSFLPATKDGRFAQLSSWSHILGWHYTLLQEEELDSYLCIFAQVATPILSPPESHSEARLYHVSSPLHTLLNPQIVGTPPCQHLAGIPPLTVLWIRKKEVRGGPPGICSCGDLGPAGKDNIPLLLAHHLRVISVQQFSTFSCFLLFISVYLVVYALFPNQRELLMQRHEMETRMEIHGGAGAYPKRE